MEKLIVANIKMNFTLDEALKYKEDIDKKYSNLVICPPYVYINDMKSSSYAIGSQDGFYKDKGAFTGEVSFLQLKSIGVEYSIIGHSERRHILGETDQIVKMKYDSCIDNQITPILCVGETKEERDTNKIDQVISRQLESIFDDKRSNKFCIIAYEPVWAIGTSVTPTLKEIEEVHISINNIMKKYNVEYKILYGGSVSLNNIEEFSKSDLIDGFLIGSASLNTSNLKQMLDIIM